MTTTHTNPLPMNLFGYERRTTMTRTDDIDEMIRNENDPKERNILLILQCLTAQQASSARVLESLEKKLSDQHDEMAGTLRTHGDKLQKHDNLVLRGQTVWWVISALFGVWSTVIITVGWNTFRTISDIQIEVTKHSVLIPEISKALEIVAEHNMNSSESSDLLRRVRALDRELDVIKEKRVIKNSR